MTAAQRRSATLDALDALHRTLIEACDAMFDAQINLLIAEDRERAARLAYDTAYQEANK